LRKKQPDIPRAFKTPLVPIVPILGIVTCLFMMVFLPLDTWIRLIVWMIIGFDIYLYYGVRHSALSDHAATTYSRSNRIVSNCGLVLVLLLIVVTLLHHSMAKDDTGLFYFSMIFSVLHILLYLQKILRNRSVLKQ
jgi:APA family basic amino acid/polyamine antiporter